MHEYNDIISLENLCFAWQEFLPCKKSKKDVAKFTLHLSKNIFALHEELKNKSYRHGGYKAFGISDPKPRSIHKATVRDRVLHHAIYRILFLSSTASSYTLLSPAGITKAHIAVWITSKDVLAKFLETTLGPVGC